ncbi:MAG: phosphatase PAP2 family protein [Clostridia bacterium]|nr:phosphatase PAP2 family protein [Clostridia bacterium]
MEKRSVLLYLIISFAVFAALATVAAVFDYDLSGFLADLKEGEYYSSNGFSRFIEIYGETPLYLFLCYAFAVIYWNAFYFGKPAVRYIVCAVCVIAIAVCCFTIPARIRKNALALGASAINGKALVIAVEVITGMIVGIAVTVGVMFTGKENVRAQLSFAVAVLFVAFASQVFSQGLKLINKRVRYRALNAYGGEFTPWYKFNGYPESFKALVLSAGTEDAVKSFPSGHTASAGIVYTLIALPYVFQKFAALKWKVFFACFSVFITGIVAYARIRMGAHYFSDVLFGGSVSFFFSLIAIYFIYERKTVKSLAAYCKIT